MGCGAKSRRLTSSRMSYRYALIVGPERRLAQSFVGASKTTSTPRCKEARPISALKATSTSWIIPSPSHDGAVGGAETQTARGAQERARRCRAVGNFPHRSTIGESVPLWDSWVNHDSGVRAMSLSDALPGHSIHEWATDLLK